MTACAKTAFPILFLAIPIVILQSRWSTAALRKGQDEVFLVLLWLCIYLLWLKFYTLIGLPVSWRQKTYVLRTKTVFAGKGRNKRTKYTEILCFPFKRIIYGNINITLKKFYFNSLLFPCYLWSLLDIWTSMAKSKPRE